MGDNDLMAGSNHLPDGLSRTLNVAALIFRGLRFSALEYGIAAKGDDQAHGLGAEGRDEDRLDRVHPVFRLIEDD